MSEPTPNVDPKNKGRAMYDEADIGSGEKSPGQHETDEMIRGIPALPPSQERAGQDGAQGEKQDEQQGEKQEEKPAPTGA